MHNKQIEMSGIYGKEGYTKKVVSATAFPKSFLPIPLLVVLGLADLAPAGARHADSHRSKNEHHPPDKNLANTPSGF